MARREAPRQALAMLTSPFTSRFRRAALAAAIAAAIAAPAAAQDSTSRVVQLQAEAKALAPLVKTPLAREFLAMVPRLPSIQPRTVYRDSSRTHAWTSMIAKRDRGQLRTASTRAASPIPNSVTSTPQPTRRAETHPPLPSATSPNLTPKRAQICLIEFPCGALRVSVASGFGGLALELPAVAFARSGLRTKLSARRVSPLVWLESGATRTILRNQECPPRSSSH
jgi:hypothetical protein